LKFQHFVTSSGCVWFVTEADANLPKGKRPVTATSKGSSDMTPKTNTKGNQPRVSPPLPVAAAAAAVGIGQVHPGELSWMVLCGTSLNADQEARFAYYLLTDEILSLTFLFFADRDELVCAAFWGSCRC
jgi:hypothetical protein